MTGRELYYAEISVLVQRLNAVLLRNSLLGDRTDALYTILYISIFKLPREHIHQRQNSKNNNNRMVYLHRLTYMFRKMLQKRHAC